MSDWSDRFSEGRLDELYWSSKYADEPECDEHGADEMYFDFSGGEYYCLACQKEDELTEAYKNG